MSLLDKRLKSHREGATNAPTPRTQPQQSQQTPQNFQQTQPPQFQASPYQQYQPQQYQQTQFQQPPQTPQTTQYHEENKAVEPLREQLMKTGKSTLLKEKLTKIETEKKEIEENVDKAIVKVTDDERVLVDFVTGIISEKFKHKLAASGNNMSQELCEEIKEEVTAECSRLKAVGYEAQQRIKKVVISQIIGLGPLDPYMEDKKVTEIIVQKWDNIVIEREGKIYKVNATFSDEQHLQTVIQRIVQPIGRQINVSQPIVDARLRDGSRVCATLPPASPDGATLDIRRFYEISLTGEDYVRLGSMSPPMLEFLEKAVQAKSSIIISGGTGTGKTTLLNMLSGAIPKDELIITIEDSCELKLESENVRRLETRNDSGSGSSMKVDTKALVKTSLRMRPDRIVVGEIRDGTITDMISAMSTGHEGSMCTVHANSAVSLVNTRIPMLYSMSDTSFTETSQNIQIAEALDLIVQIKRYGKLRAIQSITEITGVKHGKVELQDIFRYDNINNEFYATGYIPKRILSRMVDKGIAISEEMFKSREERKKEALEMEEVD